MSTVAAYPLYYTLCKDMSRGKGMNKTERKKIISSLSDCVSSITEKEKEAVLLLIVEHFRTSEKKDIDFMTDDIFVPYEAVKTRNGIKWKYENIPDDLLNILQKFFEVSRKTD